MKNFHYTWLNDFYHAHSEKGLIALAWWTGSYFAEQIRSITGSYPFIEIVGEAGAGKSRLIEMLWKLSGRPDYEGFNPSQSSNAVIYRIFTQKVNLPIVLIDGDQTAFKRRKFGWNELKDKFYSLAISDELPVRGAIMISQNANIQAPDDIFVNTIHLFFDRKGQSLETKRIVDALDRIPLEDACTYMTHCLRKEKSILATYKEKLANIEQQYHSAGITHTRIALCHAQIAALIEALAEHVLDGALDYEEVAAAQDMLLSMAQQRTEQLNGDTPKRKLIMTEKIYAMKASRSGSKASGRFKAVDIHHAKQQALEYLSNWGTGWSVKMTELKNQNAAMKKFNEQQKND